MMLGEPVLIFNCSAGTFESKEGKLIEYANLALLQLSDAAFENSKGPLVSKVRCTQQVAKEIGEMRNFYAQISFSMVQGRKGESADVVVTGFEFVAFALATQFKPFFEKKPGSAPPSKL